MENGYSIKEIAASTGISSHTLRYYERIGLLDEVERDTSSGHRRYTDADIQRLYFLKRVKATGMSIKEMLHYVELFRAGDATLEERYDILTRHRQYVQAQMDFLQETLTLLDTKLARYQHHDGVNG